MHTHTHSDIKSYCYSCLELEHAIISQLKPSKAQSDLHINPASPQNAFLLRDDGSHMEKYRQRGSLRPDDDLAKMYFIAAILSLRTSYLIHGRPTSLKTQAEQ